MFGTMTSQIPELASISIKKKKTIVVGEGNGVCVFHSYCASSDL